MFKVRRTSKTAKETFFMRKKNYKAYKNKYNQTKTYMKSKGFIS